MKNVMLKRLLAVVMAVAMVMTWMVVPVTAIGTDGEEAVTPQCSCENKCTEDAANADCAVCGAEGADLTACVGTAAENNTAEENEEEKTGEATPAAETPVCNGAESCTLGADAEGHIEGCQYYPTEDPVVCSGDENCTLGAEAEGHTEGCQYYPGEPAANSEDAQVAPVTTLEDLKTQLAAGGEITLGSSIQVTETLYINTTNPIILDLGTYTLSFTCGNHTITGTSMTIKNGNFNFDNATATGNAMFELKNASTLNFENVNISGQDCSTAYGVFYPRSSSAGVNSVSITGGSVKLINDAHPSGGFFKCDDDTQAVLTINGTSEVTLKNAQRFAVGGIINISNTKVSITATSTANFEHGFNGSTLTLSNVDLTMSGGSGRGITIGRLFNNTVSIDAASTVDIKDMGEGAIVFHSTAGAGSTLTIAEGAQVTLDGPVQFVNGATVSGSVTIPDVTTAADLVNAAKLDGTVTLANDITLTETVVIDKAVTLNLNGKTVNFDADAWDRSTDGDALFTVKRGGSLTINGDGTVDGTGDANDVYAAVKMTEKGEAADGTAATLTVNGGTLKGHYYAVSGNGSRHNTAININGGTLEGMTAIYHPQIGTLNISGGTLTGSSTGIELRSGTLTITGGTITGNGNPASDNANGSGTTLVGAAVGVSQHTTNKNINVTISGGTMTGAYALREVDTVADGASNVTLTVTGGTFNGDVKSDNINGYISGGTITGTVADGDIALGYEQKTDGKIDVKEEKIESTVEAPKAESTVQTETKSETVKEAVTEITSSTVNNNTTVTDSINNAVSADTVTSIVQNMTNTADATDVIVTVDIVLTGVSTDDSSSTGSTETVTTLTYEVEPQVQVVKTTGEGATATTEVVAEKKVENDQLVNPITFRLPIPASVTAKYVNVTHDGTFLGAFAVQGEGNNKYIELTSSTFSPWVVEILNDVTTLEAEISGTKYATIEEAYDNAANGSTIKLLENVSTAETLTVDSGDNITVDLNGKTHTYTGTDDAFTNYGTLTLTNSGSEGKFVDSTNVVKDREFVHNVSGTLNITNCVIESTNIAVWNVATATISGATITTSTTDAAKNTYTYSVYNRGTMAISNSTLTASYGVVSNTSAPDNNDASNTLTITGSTLTGAQDGQSPHTYTVYTGKGITNIVSGTFSGNNESVGAGGLESTVTIKDGTFAGGLFAYGNSEKETTGTIKVEGGTFTDKDNVFSVTAGTWLGDAAADGKIIVSGGSFAVEPPEDVLAENFSPVKNEDGSYGVKKDPVVAKIGEKEFYTIEAAFDAANEAGDGSVITLVADATVADTALIVEEGVSIILDLNGKTLTSTFTQGNALSVEAGGTLIIRDSGTNGTFTNTTESVLIVNEGTLKVEGGKLEAKGGPIDSRGTTTISGGTMVSESYTVDYGGGKLTITGGTITGEIAVFVRAEDFDTVSITGGTFTSTSNSMPAVECDDYLVAPIISGGEFTGAEAPSENLAIENHYFAMKAEAKNTWVLAEYPHHLVGTDKEYANSEQTALEVVLGNATDGTDAMNVTMTHNDTFKGEYKISRKLTIDAAGFTIGSFTVGDQAKITVPADSKNNVEFLNVGKNKLGFILTPGFSANFSDDKVVITPTFNTGWNYSNPLYLTSNGSAEKGWTCYAETKGAAFTINWKDNTVGVSSGKYEIFSGHVGFQYSKLTAYNVNTGKEITTWYTESGVDVQMIGNGFHSAVKDYYIGNVKNPKNTSTSSGSTILTLKAEYLKTLAVGEYKIVINYMDGGQSEGTLRISDAPDPENPKTGDTIMTTVVIMAASGAALAALIIFNKKRKRA